MKISIHPLGPDLHARCVSTDRELATRLRHSFAAIVPAADLFADTFYERIFTAAPAVRAMFPPDMREQKTKLLATLGPMRRNKLTYADTVVLVNLSGRGDKDVQSVVEALG